MVMVWLLVSITIDLKSYCSLYDTPMQYKRSSHELMNIVLCTGPIAIDILHYYTWYQHLKQYESLNVSGIYTKAICLINGTMLLIVSVVVQILSKLLLVITFCNNVVIDFRTKPFHSLFTLIIKNAPNTRREKWRKTGILQKHE